MQLRAVLEAFESGQSFTLPQLARRLNVEPGLLEDMIQFCPVVTSTGPRRYELASGEPLPVLNCQRPQ
jgi:hypothetical protein